MTTAQMLITKYSNNLRLACACEAESWVIDWQTTTYHFADGSSISM